MQLNTRFGQKLFNSLVVNLRGLWCCGLILWALTQTEMQCQERPGQEAAGHRPPQRSPESATNKKLPLNRNVRQLRQAALLHWSCFLQLDCVSWNFVRAVRLVQILELTVKFPQAEEATHLPILAGRLTNRDTEQNSVCMASAGLSSPFPDWQKKRLLTNKNVLTWPEPGDLDAHLEIPARLPKHWIRMKYLWRANALKYTGPPESFLFLGESQKICLAKESSANMVRKLWIRFPKTSTGSTSPKIHSTVLFVFRSCTVCLTLVWRLLNLRSVDAFWWQIGPSPLAKLLCTQIWTSFGKSSFATKSHFWASNQKIQLQQLSW